MARSFKIISKNKELVLFENGKFLFVEGEKIMYGDILLIETPTNNLLSIRAHNLVEKRISVDKNEIEELKKWLIKVNEGKVTFKENVQDENVVKKKKKKMKDESEKVAKEAKKEQERVNENI